MRLVLSMNAAVSARLAETGRLRSARRSPCPVRNPEHPAGAARDFRDRLVAEVMQYLVKGRVHGRQGRQLLDQRVALRERLLAQDRTAVGVRGGAAHQVPVAVGEGFLELHGKGVGEEVEDGLAGGEVDAEVVPFRRRYLGDAPLHQGLAGGHELDHGGPAGVEVGLDRADQRGALHGRQEMAEEALLGALEGAQRRGLGVPVEGGTFLHDARGLERGFDVGVDDLERAGVGIVDAPLLVRELMHEDVHLDAVIGQCAGLVETEGLQVPRDHFHGGDPARFHGRHEIAPALEGRFGCAPEPETPGIGKSLHGGGAGGRDVSDPRVGQRVLEPQARAALGRRPDVAALALRPRGVGHRMSLIEDDGAVEGMAGVLVGSSGEPAHDLVEPRGAALAGRRAQGGVGGEEDSGRVRDLGALAEVAEWDQVVLASAQRGPVAAGVFQELVRLAEPKRPLLSAEPAVEDDGRHLASLAAARAVAQHPAPAEADRCRQRLAVVREGDVARVPVAAALDGLPAGTDPVACSQVATVGLARQYDAFELGVRQKAVRDDAFRQHGAVGRRRMGDGGHCRGLHQGRRMRDSARNPDGAGAPGLVGSGDGAAGVRAGIRRAGLDGQLGHGPPVMGRFGCGRRGHRRGLSLGRARRGRVAEEVPAQRGLGGADFHRQAGRNPGDDRVEQLRGSLSAGAGIDVDAGPARAVEHGEPGVEAGAPARVGAAVDRHGEHDAGGRIEAAEGVVPVGIAGNAVGGRDGGEPASRRQHGEGGTHMTEVGVVADAVDARCRRERRVHDDNGGPGARQAVGDVLGVHAGDQGFGEQAAQEGAADVRDLVQMQVPGDALLPSAHSAITASMPVPADGSSTTSPGRIAAACNAA